MTRRVRAARGRLARRGGRARSRAACASASTSPLAELERAVRRASSSASASARSASSASPGEELDGRGRGDRLHRGAQAASRATARVGKRVVVIGGGNTVDRLRDAGARARRRRGHAGLSPPARGDAGLRARGGAGARVRLPLRVPGGAARIVGTARSRASSCTACGWARPTRRGGASRSRRRRDRDAGVRHGDRGDGAGDAPRAARAAAGRASSTAGASSSTSAPCRRRTRATSPAATASRAGRKWSTPSPRASARRRDRAVHRALAGASRRWPVADLKVNFAGIESPESVLARLGAADEHRRPGHARVRRRLGRRGVEDARRSDRQRVVALLDGRLRTASA